MTPYELVARHVEPMLRALLAEKLAGHGMSQGRIALLLSVTQPMVRRYLGSAGRARKALLSAGLDEGELETVVEVLGSLLARGDAAGYRRALAEMMAALLASGSLCSLHKSLDRGVPPGCSLCQKLFSARSDPHVEDVRNAVSIVLSEPLSYRLVPEVGMNVVSAPSSASSPEEVVGIPGRIVRAGKRVVAVGEPVYGGSRHTASVMLAAKSKWPEIRAAIVIRRDPGLLEKLRGRIAVSGPHPGGRRLLESIRRALWALDEKPDALIDAGGEGVEPVAYLFASTATEAAGKAVSLLYRRR